MAAPISAPFPHLILPKGHIKDGLYSALRDAILDGRLTAGTKLPSSRALADMMSISRNSVLAALERLLDEGYLFTKPSSGTYVAEVVPDQLIHIQESPKKTTTSKPHALNINPNMEALLASWREQSWSNQKKKCSM